MKSRLLNKATCVPALILGLSVMSALAETGTVTIQGTVSKAQTITVTPVAGYNLLDVVAGGSGIAIATVKEKSNSKAGYKVTVRSATAFAASGAQATLKGAAVTDPETVNYAIKYAGTAVTLVSGEAEVTSATDKTGGTGLDKAVTIDVTGTWVGADTYSDTLTFTITSN